MKDLDLILTGIFNGYKQYNDSNDFDAAFSSLGEIYNIITNNNVHGDIKKKWIHVLQDNLPVYEKLEEVNVSLMEHYNQIKQILSYGESYTEEEFLLLLSLRIDMELVKALFDFLHLRWDVPDCAEFDKEIVRLSGLKNNQKEYAVAISQLSKNTKVPIKTEWF